MRHDITQEKAREVFTRTFMQRIINRQADLQKIWQDAMETSPEREIIIIRSRNEETNLVHVVERACMRRGWKIVYTPKTGMYELLRTNTSDYYKHATEKDVDFFLKEGWLRACDIKQLERDRNRLDKFNKKIDNANKQRNDSLMTHWRKRRLELIENITSIEEKLNKSLS